MTSLPASESYHSDLNENTRVFAFGGFYAHVCSWSWGLKKINQHHLLLKQDRANNLKLSCKGKVNMQKKTKIRRLFCIPLIKAEHIATVSLEAYYNVKKMILDTNDPNSSLILAQDTGLWESFWDTFVFSIPHPWNCAAERITWKRVSLVTQTIKHLSANAGDTGSIPGSGRFPAEGDGNPLPIFLPGKFHGQRSLEGYSPWGPKEWDMNWRLYNKACRTNL